MIIRRYTTDGNRRCLCRRTYRECTGNGVSRPSGQSAVMQYVQAFFYKKLPCGVQRGWAGMQSMAEFTIGSWREKK
ncbi:hypothetical protein IMSAG249_00907 [Lachnospiraceae bacterium]|nr:hypothetical protein IMSAG249_00907 [Lachnospiraceae bacterium]